MEEVTANRIRRRICAAPLAQSARDDNRVEKDRERRPGFENSNQIHLKVSGTVKMVDSLKKVNLVQVANTLCCNPLLVYVVHRSCLSAQHYEDGAISESSKPCPSGFCSRISVSERGKVTAEETYTMLFEPALVLPHATVRAELSDAAFGFGEVDFQYPAVELVRVHVVDRI